MGSLAITSFSTTRSKFWQACASPATVLQQGTTSNGIGGKDPSPESITCGGCPNRA
eukprot:CAMPEP_0172845914 /NCGR_PEP_ID=MMETSP1075-20121228/35357_1 /TAXON_ID=2916 /ORGANISM="Ceratium fusus, Strain PA161109" /LENGTH=55 /DNA_ID=CAMNT_0013690609 /DNA_START=224 /DNA_END=387 /DNA_ORIENTATION=-